jgi:hypothetical protein
MYGVIVTYCIFTGRVQSIVRGFNSDWKRALELINGDVMRAFTNFKNGTQILQVRKFLKLGPQMVYDCLTACSV